MVEHILAADDGSGATGGILLALFWIASVVAYWIPTIVAVVRKVPNKGSVIVINLFLGWTIIGWVVALAMAARSRTQPQQFLQQPYPPQQYPPQQYQQYPEQQR